MERVEDIREEMNYSCLASDCFGVMPLYIFILFDFVKLCYSSNSCVTDRLCMITYVFIILL